MRIAATLLVAATVTIAAGSLAAAQEREDRARREPVRGPLVTSASDPFFADGSVRVERDQRRFVAVVLTRTARVPAAWPLVIQASITLDGDVLKSAFTGLTCAPAIDGHAGLASPMPQPPAADPGGVTPGDAVQVTRGAAPLFPDLRWGGTFAAGPIPPGLHTFTLTCESASPFELRGIAMLKVSGNPSARGHE